MQLRMDYGRSGLQIDVPENNLECILSMQICDVIDDFASVLTSMLKEPIGTKPLAELAKGKTTACVVICDITRPVPNRVLLPPILTTLENNGIARENITILIATGIHRPNEGNELIHLVGEQIAHNYRIVNHFAQKYETHTYLGKTSRDTDVWINSEYINADLKITTGFIEPHLMAGFSGGRKLVVPGIASLKTVKVMHSPRILEHPNAREGQIEGNPFHEEALEIAKMAGVDFIVNVALDEKHRIIGIFAGDLEQAHAAGVDFVRSNVGDTVPSPVDIVVTSSAGYPLDATFYQAIKGLTAALPIVKVGGTIILVAECKEGLGSAEFTQLVRNVKDMDTFMHDIYRDDYFIVDQWQFEELAKVLRKANVMLFSKGISNDDKKYMPITSIKSVEDGLLQALVKHGSNATIAVIPKGPYILTGIS
ncbi:nickel-dependent lactate racemase [candidate division KSB1 bacterium]|nr:nickel-dependent lactate racemase [candidate division KSB1 bacterium]